MVSRKGGLAEHLGNLLHHLDVLRKAQRWRKENLFRIRKRLTDSEKIAIYEKFSHQVDHRLERVEYHLQKIREDCLSPEEKTHAENIRQAE